MDRLVTMLNTPDGGTGPYNDDAAPLTTSIWSNCSIEVTPVMNMVMPSTLVFSKLLPCMPRVIGRRMSGPCCSWKDTSGMYLDTSLKFTAWVFSIRSDGSTETENGTSVSGVLPRGPTESRVSTR